MPTSAAITIPIAIRGKFLSLLRAQKICEAVALLPLEIRRKFTSNPCNTTGTATPNVTIQTFTEKTIIAGLEELRISQTLIKVYAWILIFTSIAGILGNSAVIATYINNIRKPARRIRRYANSPRIKGSEGLFLHLAVCDLIFATLQAVLIFPSLSLSRWPYGIPLCKVILGSVLLGSLVAIGTILIIAMESYKIVSSRTPYQMPKCITIFKFSAVWVTAIASIVPFVLSLTVGEESGVCSANWKSTGMSAQSGKIYNLYLLIVWFLVPCAVIIFYNWNAVLSLRSTLARFDRSNMSNFQSNTKRKVRLLKRLIVVAVMFFIFVLPSRIVPVVIDFINTKNLSRAEFFALVYSGQIPYPFHVCANPIIYSFFREGFRKDIRDVIDLCCRRKSSVGLQALNSFVVTYVLGSLRKTVFRDRYNFGSNRQEQENAVRRNRKRSDIPEVAGVQSGIFMVHKDTY